MPRPRLNPTEEQRKLVKTLAAIDMNQSDIARMLNIRSPKTLRKYFPEELDRGKLEGYAKVKQTDYQMATDGKHALTTKGWLNSYERRHGHDSDRGQPVQPPSFIIVPES